MPSFDAPRLLAPPPGAWLVLTLLLWGPACDRIPEESLQQAEKGPAAPSNATAPSATRPSAPPPQSSDPSAKEREGRTEQAEYATPELSADELMAALKRTCEDAAEMKSRMLIEFSAPWCGDCRRLHRMKATPVLQQALSKVPHLIVNIGRFDNHEELLESFDIKAIANWHVVETTDCKASPTSWPRVAQRTLERRAGSPDPTPSELAHWLLEQAKRPEK